MAAFVPVAQIGDIPENGSREIDLSGEIILLCRVAGKFFAVQGLCPHANAPLAGGRIRGWRLSCPLHGANFDLRDGGALGGITRISLKTYPVRVEDDMVSIAMDNRSQSAQ